MTVLASSDCLHWSRDNLLSPIDSTLTKRQLFSWTGQLVGHYPVAGWLRPACSYIKRSANSVQWDELVEKSTMKMVDDIQLQLREKDPVVCGVWSVPATSVGIIWCDASSLALGVVVEIGGSVV